MSTWLDDILELHDKLNRLPFIPPPNVQESLKVITGAILELQERFIDEEKQDLTCVYMKGFEDGKDSVNNEYCHEDPGDVSDHSDEVRIGDYNNPFYTFIDHYYNTDD